MASIADVLPLFRLVNAFICWIDTGVVAPHIAKSMTTLFAQGSISIGLKRLLIIW